MEPKFYILNEKGFTLVETMVAFMIAIMILYPLTTMWLDSNEKTNYTLNKTTDMVQSQKVFSELINGRKNNRLGLRHAVRYKISASGIAFETNITINGIQNTEVIAYRVAGKNLYKITDLESIDDLLTGGNVILDNVAYFKIETVAENENLLSVNLQTDLGKAKGTDFQTKVLLRSLSSTENIAHAVLAPNNLVAIPGDEKVFLNWEGSLEPNLAGYYIYRFDNLVGEFIRLNPALTLSTSFTDTDVENGLTYLYTVSAVNNSEQESDFTDVVSAIPAESLIAPPTGLTALPGNQQIALSWNSNSQLELTGYKLYRSLTSDDSLTFLTNINANVSTYLDTGLTNGITYWYALTALDSDNQSDLSTVVSASPFTPDTTPPAKPTGLHSTGVTSSSVTLTWDSNEEADLLGYNVYVSERNGGPYDLANPTYLPKEITTYTVDGLISNNQYWFVITAVDTSNNESVQSNYEQVKTDH